MRKKAYTFLILLTISAFMLCVAIDWNQTALAANFSYTEWQDALKPENFDYIDVANQYDMAISSSTLNNVGGTRYASSDEETLYINNTNNGYSSVSSADIYENYRTAFIFKASQENVLPTNGQLRFGLITKSINAGSHIGYSMIVYGDANLNNKTGSIQIHENPGTPMIKYQAINFNIFDFDEYLVEIEVYTKADKSAKVFNIAINNTSVLHFEDTSPSALVGTFVIYSHKGDFTMKSQCESSSLSRAPFDYNIWKQDDKKPVQLTNIDIADPDIFDFDSVQVFASRASNIVEIGGNSTWTALETFNTYKNWQSEFNIIIPSGTNLDNGNFRIALRAQGASGLNFIGYFFNFYSTRFDIMKVGYDGSNYKSTFYATYPISLIDGQSHSIELQVYDRTDDSAMVINVAVDKIPFTFVDDGTQTAQIFNRGPVPESMRPPYKGGGKVNFHMSSASKVILVSDISDNNFQQSFLSGKATNWLNFGDSQAQISDGTIGMEAEGSKIYSAEPSTDTSTKINFSVANRVSEGYFLAIALNFQTFSPSYNFFDPDTHNENCYIIKVFADKYTLNFGGEEIGAAYIENLDDGNEKTLDINVYKTAIGNVIYLSLNGNKIYYFDKGSPLTYEGYRMISNHNAAVTLTADYYVHEPFKVLFCGNSITNHAGAPDQGWYFSWGMAVDAPEKDYVHQVMEFIKGTEVDGGYPYQDAVYKTMGMAAWERDYAFVDIANNYASYRDFDADLIVMRVAENVVNAGASYLAQNPFDQHYKNLIDFLNKDGDAMIILTTSYWGTGSASEEHVYDEAIVSVARERGYPLVRLGDLGSTYSDINHAYGDQEYYENTDQIYIINGEEWTGREVFHGKYDQNGQLVNPGYSVSVKAHPGINGMKAIADRINESVQSLLTGGDGHIQVFEYFNEDKTLVESKTGELQSFSIERVDDDSQIFEDMSNNELIRNEKLILYKLFSVNTQGDYYRFTMYLPLSDAIYDFEFWYFDEQGEGELLLTGDINYLREGTYNPRIFVSKKMNGYFAWCINGDFDELFKDSNGLYGAIETTGVVDILKFTNRKNEKLVIDLTLMENKVNRLTLYSYVYPGIISGNKDISIILANNIKINITSDVFELMAKTTDNLYFSAERVTNTNQLNNLSTLENDKCILAREGNSVLAFNINIRYNHANGDPVTVFSGIDIEMPFTFETGKYENPVMISAEVAPISGRTPQKVTMTDEGFSLEADKILVDTNYFDRTYIFASEKIDHLNILQMPAKVSYKKGEALDLAGIIVEAVYPSGYVKTIELEDIEAEYDFSAAGEKQVTLTVDDDGEPYTVSFSVNVTEEIDDTPENPAPGGCSGCSGYSGGGALFAILISIAILIERGRKICIKR